MILNYILAFSVLTLSVIKMTDIFLSADKTLKKEKYEFIRLTKEKHQKGNITLAAALFTVIISSLLYFFAFKYKVELHEARYRKTSYLCFHYLNVETEKYIKDMVKFNWLLRTAFAARLASGKNPGAEAIFRTLQLTRNLRHLSYLKILFANKYCPSKLTALSYFKNFPFETSPSLSLVTNVDASTKIRSKLWRTFIYLPPTKIRLKNSFSLEAKWRMDNAFLPKLKVETAETSNPIKLVFSK